MNDDAHDDAAADISLGGGDVIAYMRWTAPLSKRCPLCGMGPLVMRAALVSGPIGTYSLAGETPKASAQLAAVVSCEAEDCVFIARGRLVDATIAEDGQSFTGGYFVGDRVVP